MTKFILEKDSDFIFLKEDLKKRLDKIVSKEFGNIKELLAELDMANGGVPEIDHIYLARKDRPKIRNLPSTVKEFQLYCIGDCPYGGIYEAGRIRII